MNPIPVPEEASVGRPECRAVQMGPPRGVSEEHCGSVQMLISPEEKDVLLGVVGRRMFAYFRPTERELEILRTGGFIEFAQYGNAVQPFSAEVWGGRDDDDH